MPAAAGVLFLNPMGQEVVITLTGPGASKAYTTSSLVTQHTFPQTITTETAYYFSGPAALIVSATINGLEVADNGNPRAIQIDPGQGVHLAVALDLDEVYAQIQGALGGGGGAVSSVDGLTGAVDLSGSYADKTDTEAALALLAPLDAPTFTGHVTVPTPTSDTDASTKLYVDNNSGAGAVATHEADTTDVHGIADTSTLYRSGGTDVAVADGGTGASDQAGARSNLGIGSLGTQSSGSVSITGGSVTGITDLAVADGGTGASTATDARTNLGLVIGTDVAPVASPTFTGTVTVPTPTNSTDACTKGYADGVTPPLELIFARQAFK